LRACFLKAGEDAGLESEGSLSSGEEMKELTLKLLWNYDEFDGVVVLLLLFA
jgi:hypothetical protein